MSDPEYLPLGSCLPFCSFGQVAELFLSEGVGGLAAEFLEQSIPRFHLRQWDVDPAFEPAADGGVEFPGQVGRPQYQQAVAAIVPHSVHLDQELGLDAVAGVVAAVPPGAGHGVDLIDEDDAALVPACHREQFLHHFLALPHILAHDVAAGHTEKSAFLHLPRTGLGNEGLPRPWGSIQQDAFPGLAGALKNLWEPQGHDDCFFECILRLVQSRHIVPVHVGFFLHDHLREVIFDLRPVVLGFVVEHLFALIVLDVLAHLLDVFLKGVQGLPEGFLVAAALKFKLLDELQIDAFGLLLGVFHGGEVVGLVGVVELGYVAFHLLLVEAPGVVYVHWTDKSDIRANAIRAQLHAIIMRTLTRVVPFCRGLTTQLSHRYHLPSLLESKHEEEHIRLNPSLFHLYLCRLLKAPFNQRLLTILSVDCYRTAQPPSTFRTLVEYSLSHLQAFTSRNALVSMLTQMAHYHYKSEEEVLPLARRALELEEAPGAGQGWHSLKMMIALQQTTGIAPLGEEWLRKVDFSRMRPISLAMALEVLHTGGMGQSALAEELVEMFVACQQLIPLADVHHLSYAIRKVPHPAFRECYFRVRSRIQSAISSTPTPKTPANSYYTDEELLALMRQKLLSKYKDPPSACSPFNSVQ